jgi:hypothetical protein
VRRSKRIHERPDFSVFPCRTFISAIDEMHGAKRSNGLIFQQAAIALRPTPFFDRYQTNARRQAQDG